MYTPAPAEIVILHPDKHANRYRGALTYMIKYGLDEVVLEDKNGDIIVQHLVTRKQANAMLKALEAIKQRVSA